MPITIVVETGAGLPNANAPCSVATVDQFWTDRGGHPDWGTLSADAKASALVRATDYVSRQSRYDYRGTKGAGRLPWPRTGASYYRGPAIGPAEVPLAFVEAVCLMCGHIATLDVTGTAAEPSLDRGGAVSSLSIPGVISLSYGPGASPETRHLDVDGALAPLLRSAASLYPVIGSAVPAVPDVYTPGVFERAGNGSTDPLDPLTDPSAPSVA